MSAGIIWLSIEKFRWHHWKIGVAAFNGLPKLEHLSMQRKEISEIRPGTFQKINHFEYLNLAYNRIEHLVVDVF